MSQRRASSRVSTCKKYWLLTKINAALKQNYNTFIVITATTRNRSIKFFYEYTTRRAATTAPATLQLATTAIIKNKAATDVAGAAPAACKKKNNIFYDRHTQYVV